MKCTLKVSETDRIYEVCSSNQSVISNVMNENILVEKSLCGHKTESEATLKTVCPLAVNKKIVVDSHLNYNGNLTAIQYVTNWLLLQL